MMEIKVGEFYQSMPGGGYVHEVLEDFDDGRLAIRTFLAKDGTLWETYEIVDRDRYEELGHFGRLAHPNVVKRLDRAAADRKLANHPRERVDDVLDSIPDDRIYEEAQRRRRAEAAAVRRRARRRVLAEKPAGDVPPAEPELIWIGELFETFAQNCTAEWSPSYRYCAPTGKGHPTDDSWEVLFYTIAGDPFDLEEGDADLMVDLDPLLAMLDDVHQVEFENGVDLAPMDFRGPSVSFMGQYRGHLVRIQVLAYAPENEFSSFDEDDDEDDDGPPDLYEEETR